MKKEKSFFMKPLDIIICLSVTFVAVLIWILPYFTGDNAKTALVTVGDRKYYISLFENREYIYENNDYKLTVCVKDGSVYISETDCPDKVCMHSGKISRRGEVIICSPSEISVKITAGGDYDVVAY